MLQFLSNSVRHQKSWIFVAFMYFLGLVWYSGRGQNLTKCLHTSLFCLPAPALFKSLQWQFVSTHFFACLLLRQRFKWLRLQGSHFSKLSPHISLLVSCFGWRFKWLRLQGSLVSELSPHSATVLRFYGSTLLENFPTVLILLPTVYQNFFNSILVRSLYNNRKTAWWWHC